MDNPEYYECSCRDFDHTLRMTYFKDASPDDPDFLYVEVHLRQKPIVMLDYVLLFKKFNVPVVKFPRPWAALKYLFGFRSRYGDFDEFLWDPETAIKFRNHCDRYLKQIEESKEHV